MGDVTDMLVPVIDLGSARADGDGRRRAAASIDDACRTSGFFAVTDHGIDDGVIAAAVDRSREFFALPFEE